MSFIDTLRSAFKGRGGNHVPLARSFTSPWFCADDSSGGRRPYEYGLDVGQAFMDNPVAQRAIRIVSESLGTTPLGPMDAAVETLVRATSAGQSLLETLTAHLLLHGKEVFVNEAHARADMLLHPAIVGEASAPPATPQDGDCWLVGAAATAAWAGHDGQLAGRQAGNWLFAAPRDGLTVFDLSFGKIRRYANGWHAANAVAAPTGGTVIDTQARSAITGLIAALVAGGILPSA